jgi:DNA-directed RNA polymerase specialized sigma24 family protein
MNKNLSTHELLVQLKHGDEGACEIVYARHASEFFRYALGKGLTPEEAEDVVEETFDRILTCISGYSEVICGGEKWMWSICRNKTTDKLREKKRQALDLLETYPSPEAANPETYLVKQEYFQALERAWNKISESDQQEICRGRGRGPGRKAWHKAIQRLHTAISEEDSL